MADMDEAKAGPITWLVIAFMFFVVFGVMIGQMTGWY